MTDRDALYRAILADPDDDTARLVYADWLEENGRPEEAELIRVECRLEAATPDDSEYPALAERQVELRLWLSRHAHAPELRLPAGLQVRSAEWWTSTDRGLPRFLRYDGHGRAGLQPVRALGAALEKALTRVPARWLVVEAVTVAQLAELLKLPAVAGLNGLTIDLDAPDEAEADACRLIAGCPRLGNLRALGLEFPVGVVGITQLAVLPNLGGLRSLFLGNCEGLAPDAVRWLRESKWFRRLQKLSLSRLTSAGFEELCRLPPLALHTLELYDTAFEPAAWQTFARSESFPCLTRLVNHTDMHRGGIEALAAADRFSLSHLALHHNIIRDAGARALAAAPWLDSLRWLELSSQQLGPTGVAALVRSRRLANLRYLNLQGNTIGSAGLRAIAANPALRGLITLILGGDEYNNRQLTAADFAAFLSRLDMPDLRHLHLAGRPVGPRAARLLTRETFSNLTRLELSYCRLTDAAVSALLTSPTLQNLVLLSLVKNGLKEGLRPLADPGTLPRLSYATVFGNRPPRDLQRKLSRRPGLYV